MDEPERDDPAPDSGAGDEQDSWHEEQEAAAPTAEDLVALTAPPRWQRTLTLTVMAVTALACVAVAWSLRGEALYALSDQVPIDLGQLRDAPLGAQHANRYVRGTAHLEPSPTVRYARTADADQYRLAPVAGITGVWVEHRVPADLAGPRYVPPSRVAGRLVRADTLGARHRGLGTALEQAQGPGRASSTWLLLDGIDPHASRWAVAFALLLLVFAGWNVYGIARLIRRVGPA